MSTVDVRPLEGVGAEIHGVDIAAGLSNTQFDTIHKAFSDHGLIFFRDQNISENDHIELARKFGNIDINRFFAAHPDFPEIAMVSKDVDQKDNIGGGWHTDHSYDQDPAMGSILVARELPDSGGDTMFSSMYAAYDNLSDGFKKMLEGLNAVHSATHIFGSGPVGYAAQTDAGGSDGADAKGDGRIGNSSVADTMPDVIHPVIITHPLSGKKALYVNPAFTVRFEGWTEEESRPLMQQLFAECARPEYTHRFAWKPGSIAFWDNRATWHWAMNDYQGKRRVMHRITVEGCPLS
ncbi:MAG: TauD/TfdA family dioxygenase [Alphaproteobacteria bacterium]|nr:TauD/TfdA family dioxygenase [Alphaproteobacteria bacterium]